MADNEEIRQVDTPPRADRFRDGRGGQALPLAAHEHRMRLERLGAGDPYELRAVAGEVMAERDDLRAKLAAYEAGQESIAEHEVWGKELTPGQLWNKLLNATEDQRQALLMAFVLNARTASACFAQDHEGMGAQLEYNRTELAHAVFGSVTTDGTAQLHTAVRALRQVMVDGIAARSTAVEFAGEVTLDDFPVEADVKAKIGEQLKSAGIDPQSICAYEWVGDATPLCPLGKHFCSEVNPLHADAHDCNCGTSLTHEDAERLATR